MPLYDYGCPACGRFDALRRIAERDDPCPCPACGAASPRTALAAARLSPLTDERRAAHALNERSAHAPQESGKYLRAHGSGCGCCGVRPRSRAESPAGARAFPSTRPWMISH